MDDLEVICDENMIGCRLVKMNVMTQSQVDAVLEKQKNGDTRLFGEIAIEMGFINEDALQKFLESKK